MSKNYMETIAQMLGVELGEQFKVYALETLWGKITLSDKGVVLCDPDWCGGMSASAVLEGLLTGALTPKHQLWKPIFGERYYYYDSDERSIYDTECHGEMMDLTLYKIGNCYRTREAAEANKDKWKEFYESDKVWEWK